EDGIRDRTVTGVQTCALPISVDQRRSVVALQRHRTLEVVDVVALVAALPDARPGRDRRATLEILEARGDLRRERERGASDRRGRSEERRVGKECRGGGWRCDE